MNELISIIIPTYNHAHYLEDVLESIENQTIKNYEIIIIDNHSMDNTRQIINKFKKLPIKYFLIKMMEFMLSQETWELKILLDL